VWESIDDYAEKIRSLYAFAPGSLRRFAELSKIEDELNVPPALNMMANLSVDNDILSAELYKADAMCESMTQRGIQNFIQGQIDAHEKLRWQLKSFLK
jgi:starvation-inducible DNA-binding protein